MKTRRVLQGGPWWPVRAPCRVGAGRGQVVEGPVHGRGDCDLKDGPARHGALTLHQRRPVAAPIVRDCRPPLVFQGLSTQLVDNFVDESGTPGTFTSFPIGCRTGPTLIGFSDIDAKQLVRDLHVDPWCRDRAYDVNH